MMEKKFFEPATHNKRLLESDNFIVIPSLGSLVEGWLLIVPKEYSLNLSLLDEERIIEMEELARKAEGLIIRKFGKPVVYFEHGPRITGSTAGCGVDYAHLHIVPFDKSLTAGLENFLGIHYDWESIGSMSSLKGHPDQSLDYLYHRNQEGKHFITSQANIPSQLFRKVIANYLSIPSRFDWKSFPELDKVSSTVRDLETELV